MAESTTLDNGVSSVEQIESTPQGVVRRWLCEWDLAGRLEDEWRKKAQESWDLYQSKDPADNTFNILWSNVETLRPAIYNSTPRPDVRRRFRDADPEGKVAATVLERVLTYELDQNDFDHEVQNFVLDTLLTGRGVSREMYLPTFAPLDAPASGEDWLDQENDAEDAAEPSEEIVDETGVTRRVKWDKFRHGPGKTWAEVPWIGFEHEFTFDMLVKRFGPEKAARVPLSEAPDDTRGHDKDVRSLLKTATVLEIWDKEGRRCLFICEGFKEGPLLSVEDPLRLTGFFPVARPVYAIEDTTSLVPAVPYVKYEQQAKELNSITKRINKIVSALKVRGAYAGHLSEIGKVIQAADNVMIPIENASEIANLGGLDKAVWIMPIDRLIQVLEGLYVAREKTIQAIYEITGLGDIMRGVSNPHETLGAQQIKSQWGSLRLQRLQREVQRCIRDQLRIKAEIIAEHFQPDTLEAMTGIQLPTAIEKQQLQQKAMQMAAPQPTMMGAPAAPPDAAQMGEIQKILALPSWEEVMAVLKSDAMRQYRIDIETDSTVTETVMRDAQGMQEAITAITALFAGVAPAIQAGYISVDVIKSLGTAVARTARMGQAVEDALDQIQQPPPQPGLDPAQQKQIEMAQKEIEAGRGDIENGKQELQKVAQAIEKEKGALENQRLSVQMEAQRQIQTVEKAKGDLERFAREEAARLEKQARDLEALKSDIQVAQRLLAAESKIQKTEQKAARAELDAHITQSAANIDKQAVAVDRQALDTRTKAAEEAANASKSSEEVATLAKAFNDGLAKISEMQKDVASQQDDTRQRIEALASTVNKPKKVKLKKGQDGSWTATTGD